MDTITQGRINQIQGRYGEHILISKLLRWGIECFIPNKDMSGCDAMIHHNNRYIKLQLKTITKASNNTPQIRFKKGQFFYRTMDFDFCIALSLIDSKEDYFIVPIEVCKQSETIAFSESGKYQQYKDNWELIFGKKLEPLF